LYRAAARYALNAVRSRKRRALRERREYLLSQSLRAAGEQSVDPQTLLQREEGRAAVRAALQRLKTRDAELLALRYGGLAYSEIAAALRIPPAQVGVRLARAERAFKKEIERDTSR
jgi:RNA polymerase sigma factor (sigma-70 family)